MKKLFFIYVCLLTVIGFGLASKASAETEPEVYVKNISIGEKVYTAGEHISGTFLLWNAKPENVPEVYYRVSLTGKYAANGLPGVIYDSKSYGPVFLSGNDQRTVAFSYVLPQGVSGSDLGIQVRAYLKSGQTLGWSDAGITVAEKEGAPKAFTLKLVGATLKRGSEAFDVQAGPTLYKGKEGGSLVLSFVNPGEAIMVVPHVDYYNRTPLTPSISSVNEKQVQISKDVTTAVTIPLPTFDWKPGVYAGRVSLIDSQGLRQSLPVEFRYIIAGDIATIQSVTSDKQQVAQGDTVVVTVMYSGTPHDITDGTISSNGEGELAVRLFNEKNEPVASKTEKINFNQGESKQITMTAGLPATTLRAEASVMKDGTVLSDFKATLTTDERGVGGSAGDWSYWFISLTGIVIALVLLWFTRTKRMPPAMTAIFLGFMLFGFAHTTHAWTVTGSGTIRCVSHGNSPNGYCWPPDTDLVPTVTINTPSGILRPGQQFHLQGSLTARACLNKPQDIKFTVAFQGATSTYYQHKNKEGSEYIYLNHYDFSYGNFVAPQQPGTYKVFLRVDNYINIPANGDQGLRGWVEGYQTFVVQEDVASTTGDVKIVSMNADGTAHVQSPKFLEKNYGAGSAMYKKDSRNQVANFRNLAVGGAYTSSFDNNYGSVPAPTYTEIGLSKLRFENFAAAFKEKILSFIKPKPSLAANEQNQTGCDRPVPADLPQVGECHYRRGAPECMPEEGSYQDLARRASAAGSQNCLVDFYYKPGGFSVAANEVTKLVYRYGGNDQGDFDYALGNSGNITIFRGRSAANIISVTKAEISTALEDVQLDEGALSSGLTGTWQNGDTCEPDPTCTKNLTIAASQTMATGTYSVTVTGHSSVTNRTRTTSFTVRVVDGTPDLTVACRPTVINPITGAVLDPAPVAAVGQKVTWKSTVVGGQGPYTYTWSGSENLFATGVGLTQVDKTYTRIGGKTANLLVQSSDEKFGNAVCRNANGESLPVEFNPDWGQF